MRRRLFVIIASDIDQTLKVKGYPGRTVITTMSTDADTITAYRNIIMSSLSTGHVTLTLVSPRPHGTMSSTTVMCVA